MSAPKGVSQTVTSEHFETLLKHNEIILLDFWAQWCAPCKDFSRIYDEVAKLYPEVVFAKVNIEEEQELAQIFQISSIPHLIVFKQGIAVYSQAGAMPKSTLEELVQQAIEIDVSQIRIQLEQSEK